MQALINLIAGFIAMLAAAALSQFGVDMKTNTGPEREVHRIADCPDTPNRGSASEAPSRHC